MSLIRGENVGLVLLEEDPIGSINFIVQNPNDVTAIIIGIGKYPKYKPLPTVSAGVALLFKTLRLAGLPTKNIRLLTETQATYSNIVKAIKSVKTQKAIFYFAGFVSGGKLYTYDGKFLDISKLPKIKSLKYLIMVDNYPHPEVPQKVPLYIVENGYLIFSSDGFEPPPSYQGFPKLLVELIRWIKRIPKYLLPISEAIEAVKTLPHKVGLGDDPNVIIFVKPYLKPKPKPKPEVKPKQKPKPKPKPKPEVKPKPKPKPEVKPKPKPKPKPEIEYKLPIPQPPQITIPPAYTPLPKLTYKPIKNGRLKSIFKYRQLSYIPIEHQITLVSSWLWGRGGLSIFPKKMCYPIYNQKICLGLYLSAINYGYFDFVIVQNKPPELKLILSNLVNIALESKGYLSFDFIPNYINSIRLKPFVNLRIGMNISHDFLGEFDIPFEGQKGTFFFWNIGLGTYLNNFYISPISISQSLYEKNKIQFTPEIGMDIKFSKKYLKNIGIGIVYFNFMNLLLTDKILEVSYVLPLMVKVTFGLRDNMYVSLMTNGAFIGGEYTYGINRFLEAGIGYLNLLFVANLNTIEKIVGDITSDTEKSVPIPTGTGFALPYVLIKPKAEFWGMRVALPIFAGYDPIFDSYGYGVGFSLERLLNSHYFWLYKSESYHLTWFKLMLSVTPSPVTGVNPDLTFEIFPYPTNALGVLLGMEIVNPTYPHYKIGAVYSIKTPFAIKTIDLSVSLLMPERIFAKEEDSSDPFYLAASIKFDLGYFVIEPISIKINLEDMSKGVGVFGGIGISLYNIEASVVTGLAGAITTLALVLQD